MSGSRWLSLQGVEMSEFGCRVADLVGELFAGIHHIGGQAVKADWSGERFVSVVVPDDRFATYDGSLLTLLVVLAHERNVRACVTAAAYRYLRLEFMPVTRRGFFADRHPTLRESLDKFGVMV